MQDLAPDIVRQRLLIEGFFEANVDRDKVEGYLLGIAEHLALSTYGTPIVHSPQGDGKAENAGFDAFIPLIDSGISLYVWTERKFFAAVLFTCKRFEAEAAVAYTCEYFEASAIESRAF
jgi:S-adenosylmethionine/arginine decarboxylase-like enzyme